MEQCCFAHILRGSADRSARHKEQWEVESVVGKRKRGQAVEYKIVWASTWHPESDLDCSELIQEYEQRVAEGAARRKAFVATGCKRRKRDGSSPGCLAIRKDGERLKSLH